MPLSLAITIEDSKITTKGLKYINENYKGYYPNELVPFINHKDFPEMPIKLINFTNPL